jgi:hypothetical protein
MKRVLSTKKYSFIIAILALNLMGLVATNAATINVNSVITLQTACNASRSGDVIVLADGTYTNVVFTSTGQSVYAAATYVVSGGIVTSATLVGGGNGYLVGQSLTTANTNLGGTGSGLVVTVATIDSSLIRLSYQNASNSTIPIDFSFYKYNTAIAANEAIGSLKWETIRSTAGAAGVQTKITGVNASTTGGGYLQFFTRPSAAYSSLSEVMRIDQNGSVGIGATSLTQQNLRVSKNITGSTFIYAVTSDGVIQSDVTSQAHYFYTVASTAAASFALTNIFHYRAAQGTFGAGSSVSLQAGFYASSTLVGATTNYGFWGNIPSAANRWNIYIDGTASNYMAGVLTIGTTSPSASAKVQIDSTSQGFLPPRMTLAQRTAIATPVTGLIVYQTDGTEGLWVKTSTTWREITVV